LGIAQDLLEQAEHLATYKGVAATQADLRRAVSTAYYALFHLRVKSKTAILAGMHPVYNQREFASTHERTSLEGHCSIRQRTGFVFTDRRSYRQRIGQNSIRMEET
jgi:hypothetical protein